MRRSVLASACFLLLPACNGGSSSPTAVTPPPWQPPEIIPAVAGTWTGTVAVETARFGRRSSGQLTDDSCLLRSGGTEPGAIDSLTLNLFQSVGRDVQGVHSPGSGPGRPLQGIAGPSFVDYSLGRGDRDRRVNCSDGSRFLLRLESSQARLDVTNPGPRTLSGEETIVYEVLRRLTGEHVGWLEHVTRVHVTQ